VTTGRLLDRLRKFAIVAYALVAATALCASGHITGAEFVDLTRWVVGIGIAGNVASAINYNFTKAPKSANDEGSQP